MINMNLIRNYSERRQKQLDAIDRIDSILINSPCKDIIVSYLILSRRVNKKHFEEFTKTSWWKKKDLLEEDLLITDKHIEDIQSRIDKGEDPCVFLQSYI